MDTVEYLEAVLRDQELGSESQELTDLRRSRDAVESLIRAEFGAGPAIRYGGSKAKGTMNRESYDLDLTCYFTQNDASAGTTIEEIYTTVEAALRNDYWTERKTSAIRLRSRDEHRSDFHIDVVPGRFVDGNDGDVHLHRTTGDKKYLKTNLGIHIAHVRDSGVVPAIRLLKLWACRNYVGVKTFALELLSIRLLDGRKTLALPEQLTHVLTRLRDDSEDLCIEDPANPHGNDLSELLNSAVRFSLETSARSTLSRIDEDGWEGVFGLVRETDDARKVAALKRMAAVAPVRPKPYGMN
jgi:hypothetical protein